MISFTPALSGTLPQPPNARPSKNKQAQNFQGVNYKTPTSTLEKMKKVGIDELTARNLNIQLSKNGDFPYETGKLPSGQFFVVTNEDRLFTGPANQLKETSVESSFRTRCVNNQKRVVESSTGYRITVQENNGIRRSKVETINPAGSSHSESKPAI